MLWLVLEALDTGHVHRPGQRRAAPTLLCRTQLGATVERAHPQPIGRWVGARGRRIDRCAAFGAERVRPLVPAFSGLDVDLRCSALQDKGAGQARHVRAKSGAGEGLTIGAMADPDLGRVDLGLKADLTGRITRLGVLSNGKIACGFARVGRVLERHSDRCYFAITVLTAGNEHVRKLGVDSAISTRPGAKSRPF